MLERSPHTRYEAVRKSLDMHPQAFQRLLYWMRGFGFVRMVAKGRGKASRAGIAVHLELSTKGEAMLDFLRDVEKSAQARRDALGLHHAESLTVA